MTGAIGPTEPALPSAVEAGLTPDEIANLRKYCNWLARWRHCDEPACKRAHACTGDPYQCFGRFYVACPEHLLVWVNAGVMAVKEGRPARVATRWADRALLSNLKATNGLPRPRRSARKRPVQATSAPSPRSAARRASPCAAPPATS